MEIRYDKGSDRSFSGVTQGHKANEQSTNIKYSKWRTVLYSV